MFLWWLLSFDFLLVNLFPFCVGNEFRHCVGRLVLALCRQWFSALYWRLSSGFGLDFLVLEQCYYCSQYIVCSFTWRYFEKALFYTVSIILVILSMKIGFAEIKWKLPKCNMFYVFVKILIIMRLAFPLLPLIMLLTGFNSFHSPIVLQIN